MRNRHPVITNLLIINFLFWLASIALPTRYGIDVTRYLGLHYWQSDNFLPFQLVTYMFLHDTGSMTHLLCNMFGVWMFGRTLEEVWGGKKFLFFYFVAGIGAGIVQEATWYIDFGTMIQDFDAAIQAGSGASLEKYQSMLAQGDITQASASDLISLRSQLLNALVTVGASGALFGMLLAFGWLFPKQRIYLYFLIPIPAWVFVAAYAVLELCAGMVGPADGVAHFAHLGGMLFAAILLLLWKKQGKLY